MPSFGNITLTDAASTPVNHVFAPNTLIGNVATYADRSGGIAVGYPTLTVVCNQPTKTSRLYKQRMKLVLPVLETVSNSTYSGIEPAPTKAYDVTAIVEFIAPDRSTLQNRKDLRAMLVDLLSESFVTSLVETQETVY